MTHRKKFPGAACALACAMAFCTPAFAGQPASHAATTGSVDRAQLLAARQAAVDRAMALIEGPARKLVHRAAGDAFAADPAAVQIDADGTEHVRFTRTYRDGIPMIGGDFVLHSRDGRVLGASQTLRTSWRPELAPHVASAQATEVALERFEATRTRPPAARLVLYVRDGRPRLAHEVSVEGVRADQTPSDMRYFVDAGNGRILDGWDGVQTAGPGGNGPDCADATPSEGIGRSLNLGTVAIDTVACRHGYQLMDPTRGGSHVLNMGLRWRPDGVPFSDADNTWGNGWLDDAATAAVDAHVGIAATWDYFKDAHGRLGIADDGIGTVGRVHFGTGYENAFWQDRCFCITFGDGDNGVYTFPLVAIDVAAHEMSHGVTSRTAGLVYSGESGALNEATSDIFGTLVEFHAGHGADPGDYLIAENIPPGDGALRYMFKPSLDYRSFDCYVPGIGGADVHFSSGIANHFFYLLAEGAVVPEGFGEDGTGLVPGDLVCNGDTSIEGIGRDAAGAIWYRALTVYMTSLTDYAGARVATLAAAGDLYGAGSQEQDAVAAAWGAVLVF